MKEIPIIKKIEKDTGIAKILWVSKIKHCWPSDKQRCADQVEANLAPITDWTNVNKSGKNNNIFHQDIKLSEFLFNKIWLITTVVIIRKKAINRWPMTVKESSMFITVSAPNEPCKRIKKTSNE